MHRHYFVLILLSLLAVEACAPTLVRPDLSLQEVELTGVSFSSMDLAFIITVRNPNSVGVKIEKLTYQLNLDDTSLGSGELREPVFVKASDIQQVTLPFSTSFNGVSHLLKMILGQNELNYQLRGNILISKFWMKKEFPFESKGVVPLNRSTFHH